MEGASCVGAPLPANDGALASLWRCFREADAKLAAAWAAFDQAHSGNDQNLAEALFDRADAIGHEYDRVVRRIAAQPAASWEGVTLKLRTWRRATDLRETGVLDADAALAFSTYLDAIRLTSGAIGAANDAIARVALRCPDAPGKRT